MAIANLVETDTFRTWYERTNEQSVFLNTKVMADGMVVFGTYKIGANADTSLNVANNLFVNSSVIRANTITTFTSNVIISSASQLVNILANTFVIQPIFGTTVNTALLVNAVATFQGNTIFLANASITGDVIGTGNVTFNGTLTSAAGSIVARQVVYGSPGAVANAIIGNAGYANFTPTGLNTAEVLNLTPTQNTVISGIAAPDNIGAAGARVLYIQNLSPTYKVTLTSANTSSDAANRITTPNDGVADILPGAALTLIYTVQTARWRILAPQTSVVDASLSGNVSIGGTLGVAGNTTFSANFAAAPLYVDQVNGRVGIGVPSPTYQFQTSGISYFGGLLNAPSANIGQLIQTGNASIAGGGLTVSFATKAALFSNTVTVSGAAQSYIENLRVNTFSVASTVAAALFSGAGTGLTGTAAGLNIGGSANYATTAGSATYATSAGSATYATSAGSAGSASAADSVDGQHFAWSNPSNNPTYLWAADTNGAAYLAARGAISVNYATTAGSAGSAGSATTAGTASAVAAGNITGTTLAAGVTASSLASVGTITSGAWSAGQVAPSADATYTLGAAGKRWLTPFFYLSNGTADVAVTSALATKSSGEVMFVSGYTGAKNIQTGAGIWTFTWKAGILTTVEFYS